MNTRIRKLLLGWVAGYCALFCSSAFADWTLEEVLRAIDIEECEFIAIGMYERVQEIIQEENDKMEQRKNAICDAAEHSLGALAYLPSTSLPVTIGSTVPHGMERIIIRIWKECRKDLNAYRRAQGNQ